MMVLLSSDAILEKRRNIILSNKKVLQDFVEREFSQWFEWKRPNAGAIAFIKFKGPYTAQQLGELLAIEGVSFKPAYCFTEKVTPELSGYFRVGFGETNMPVALCAFRDFIQKHQDEWT